MFLLLGLLCTDPSNPTTCQTLQYGKPIDTLVSCEATGQAQLGSMTPYGIVTRYVCEPVGEDA